MKQAYLDCFSGISGDMFVGALLDVGLPLERLFADLKKIPLGFYEFKRTRALRGHLVGTRVEIRVPGKQPSRKLGDIEALIRDSELSAGVKERALKVFSRLAEAEGKLHNMPPEQKCTSMRSARSMRFSTSWEPASDLSSSKFRT